MNDKNHVPDGSTIEEPAAKLNFRTITLSEAQEKALQQVFETSILDENWKALAGFISKWHRGAVLAHEEVKEPDTTKIERITRIRARNRFEDAMGPLESFQELMAEADQVHNQVGHAAVASVLRGLIEFAKITFMQDEEENDG